MTPKQAHHDLDIFLSDLLRGFGFSQTEPLVYARPINGAVASLAFPCRLDPDGNAHFTINVWLRFDSIQRYLYLPLTHLNRPTISMPLHLVNSERKFTEFTFQCPHDLKQISPRLTADITRYAIPFQEKYSNLSELRKSLESTDPKDWFVLDPEQRISVLAAIQYAQGDKQAAICMLDNALLERRTALPKKRNSIAALHQRLSQLEGSAVR